MLNIDQVRTSARSGSLFPPLQCAADPLAPTRYRRRKTSPALRRCSRSPASSSGSPRSPSRPRSRLASMPSSSARFVARTWTPTREPHVRRRCGRGSCPDRSRPAADEPLSRSRRRRPSLRPSVRGCAALGLSVAGAHQRVALHRSQDEQRRDDHQAPCRWSQRWCAAPRATVRWRALTPLP